MTALNLASFFAGICWISSVILTGVDTGSTTNLILIVIAVSSVVGTISSIATSLIWRMQYRELVNLVLTMESKQGPHQES